jgi:hypothetical protein
MNLVKHPVERNDLNIFLPARTFPYSYRNTMYWKKIGNQYYGLLNDPFLP